MQSHPAAPYGILRDRDRALSPDTAAAARNLDVYLGYLCWQAGFETSGDVDYSSGEPRCADAYLRPEHWKLIVLAGWNDIDRRCDGYLAWLDNQRRSRIFINDLFAHIGLLTTGIFGSLNTGKQTISLVALALGFGKNIYSLYQNRILIEIEGSTLETIVFDRRLNFRETITPAPIVNKPDAVKVLRDFFASARPIASRSASTPSLGPKRPGRRYSRIGKSKSCANCSELLS